MIAMLEQQQDAPHEVRPCMNWMQSMSHLDPKYGGVSAAVPSLVSALSGQGVASSIEAFCLEGEEYRPTESKPGEVHFWPVSRLRWLDGALRARFEQEASLQDGIHIHGLWDATSAVSSRAALRRNKPYIVSCHGMLEPWALNQSKFRKQVYSALVERKVLRQARCLHALTEAEALQCRNYTGKEIPTVVIPNGVAVPEQMSHELFLNRYPGLQGRRIVLFLARLHRKKGVDLLVRAWRQVAQKVPEAVLVLAGPDSDGMASTLREMVAGDGMHDSVVFPGMLAAEMKWSAIAAAECMVLPSHSEGLSMSVLEAMGAGVPVVVTPQCNMPWIPEIGGGWLTGTAVDEIADTLVQVLGRGEKKNAEAGKHAREFIQQEYSWTSVAERMAELYRWCLGGDLPTRCEVVR